MKKSKLIELLEQVEDDSEILLWDYHNNDYQDITPYFTKQQLARASFEAYVNFIEEERKQLHGDHYTLTNDEFEYLKTLYAEQYGWEINPWVTEEDIQGDIFKVKNAYILNALQREKIIHERFTKHKYT
jgi:hypothetical protein